MTWTKGPTIGRGSTAAVSLATTFSGEIFAVKSTDLSSSAILQREKSLISQLCSPYILKCLGSDVTSDGGDKSEYNLFFEYISGGTLSDQIKKQGSLDESAIRKHAYQILMGLNYLHSKGVTHCDIKGQNILIGDEGLKIADFGCARWVDSGEVGFSGTPAYMAPEVARAEDQGFPADIWALGCTVIEMATGSHPWPEMKDPVSALYRIGFSGDVPESPGWFSDEGRDFVARCLMKCPRERWTAAELLRHPFFSSVVEMENRGIERSPTSVTDQGFWDAVEAAEFENSTEIDLGLDSDADSPARRIGDLAGDGFPARFDFAEDDDWLTVRDNYEVEECSEDLIDAEQLVMVEEGIESSSILMLDFWNEEDSSTSFPVRISESVNDFPEFRILNYFNGIMSSSTSQFPSVSFTNSIDLDLVSHKNHKVLCKLVLPFNWYAICTYFWIILIILLKGTTFFHK